MAHDPDALREEIHEAFAWRKYPGHDRLALHQPGCPGYEGETVARFLRGKDWRELTLQSIVDDPELDRNAFMSFMSAEGFVYFLPAFLDISLDVESPFVLGEALAFKLTPPGEGGSEAWQEHFSRIVSSLTPGEKRAVIHVLEYLVNEYEKRGYGTHPAREALDGYWACLTDEELKQA
ncbi:hypothetical protein JQX13_07870 [Archangium violaceum]|uniref:DUF6714 family protein n=1 Tax=Archangium violaceum TaxID=83451 RepID=UPI00193BA6EB|nr:DUF6714 family protein [Archangium violaceum]QRK10007.1 hypothetical protein JQX13_07870 [Archangium violaceum]